MVARAVPAAMVGRAVLGRCQPLWWGVSACAWPASMVGGALLVRDLPPWLGVLCWCVLCWPVARLNGWACCAGSWPAGMVECAVQACFAAACLASLIRHVPLSFARLHGQACAVGA